MAKLMIHRDLLKSLGGLPTKVQKKISELVKKFQDDSTQASIHLEPLAGAVDKKVRSARVGQEYRAIVVAPDQGDTFLLMHVGHHDKAYQWCENKQFEVHPSTGVLQVFDVQEVAQAASSAPPAESSSKHTIATMSDDDLFDCGVPKPLLPAIRSVDSDRALESLVDYLPKEAGQILYGIACGMSKDEAIEEVLGNTIQPKKTSIAGPGDFTQLDEAANFDLVFVDGEEHLKDILSASLDEWRVFLHPYQRKLVQWRTKGPMKINGAAGTGKTVVLMHRAVHLARQLQAKNERVLITTFTSNLSATIKTLVHSLDPTVAERIEVTHLHSLARTICARAGWKGRIAEPDELREIWDLVWADVGTEDKTLTREFLETEFDEIVDPMGLDSEDAYLSCVRSGRPRIGRKQRKQIWAIVLEVQRLLKKRNILTWNGLIHEARLALEQDVLPAYRHVLVDEIQDFGLEALRLIAALAPLDSEDGDPLCLVGDGHQRIYAKPIALSRAGINVRGRSRRLKINYRTSKQIRVWAQHILEGREIDDLDGGLADTTGDRSAFEGPEPKVVKCTDEAGQGEAVVEWVKELMNLPDGKKLASHEICVTPNKPHIRTALANADIPTLELLPKQADPKDSETGVRLGSRERIKGLEFRAVAIIGLIENGDEVTQEEHCRNYVAATRAREFLLVTRTNSESEQ